MGAFSRMKEWMNTWMRAKVRTYPGFVQYFAEEFYKVAPGLTIGPAFRPDPINFPNVWEPLGAVGEKEGEIYLSNNVAPANAWIWQGGAWNGLAGGAGSTPIALQFYHKFPDDADDLGAYREIAGGAFPTNITWYTSPAKTTKIAEWIISRDGNQTPTQIDYRYYAANVLVRHYTDIITNSGPFETSRTRSYV